MAFLVIFEEGINRLVFALIHHRIIYAQYLLKDLNLSALLIDDKKKK
jgi:hypothetical protein